MKILHKVEQISGNRGNVVDKKFSMACQMEGVLEVMALMALDQFVAIGIPILHCENLASLLCRHLYN